MSVSVTSRPSERTAAEREDARYRAERLTYRIAWYALCVLICLLMIGPLLWMITIALKSVSDVHRLPPQLIPSEFHFENFIKGPQEINFPRLFLNTVIVSGLSTLGSVVSSMLVGYGLARVNFPGKRLWFYIFVGSIFVPPMIGLIPLVQLAIKINIYDTWLPLILPAWLANPVFIFLFRQYAMTIPRSLDEAAVVDGANHWTIFTRIMVPLTRPVWITMAILAFQGSWNDYLTPLVYLTSDDKFTLALGMASFSGAFASVAVTQYNYFMATNLLYMLPPLLLFFVAQRYFMQGLGSLGSLGQK